LFEVEGCGIPFERGIEGKDEFSDVVLGDALFDSVQAKRRGMAAVEGGKEVFDDVVEAVVGAGFFNGIDVTGGGENAERTSFPAVRGAETAGVLLSETAASGARDDVVRERNEEGTELFELGWLPPDEFESEALGCATADTGKFFEVSDERVEGFWVFWVHEEETWDVSGFLSR